MLRRRINSFLQTGAKIICSFGAVALFFTVQKFLGRLGSRYKFCKQTATPVSEDIWTIPWPPNGRNLFC